MSIEESTPYNVQNIICLTKNFVRGGLNVIISYPVSSESHRLIERELSDLKQSMYAFTLAPRLEVALRNRGGRQLADWEVKKIKQDYAEGFHQPDYGTVIDNSDQTPEETSELILKKIKL